MRTPDLRPLPLAAALVLGLSPLMACSSSDGESAGSAAVADSSASSESAAGVRVVSAAEAAAIVDDPPTGLVVLDVRTPEEFADGHLDGALNIDFYAPDFADQLATLADDAPYVLYCRSGNRSGQVAAMMTELGFVDVADIDGGIMAWTAAGLPVAG